jgi:hypothetical protein
LNPALPESTHECLSLRASSDLAAIAQHFSKHVDLAIVLRDQIENVGVEESGECVENSIQETDGPMNMLRRSSHGIVLLTFLVAAACERAEPLTAAKAEEIVRGGSFKSEPVYAEVPQKVWWTPKAPKDDYDEKALRTLRNLERAGLVTVTASDVTSDSATYLAKVTRKGFPILGTAPSYRGPVYRGLICEKRYDGLRNFVRHPSEETVGHAELVWHYDHPTWLYPLFETKIDKPLAKPYASHISFWYEKHEWKFAVNVKKAGV